MQTGPRARLYSIVVPTRERHDVLEHTLRTVLRQTRPNFEIVVVDNRSSPETKAVVDAFASPHIRYVRSPERLAMAENWELGLSHAQGDYITILGDDDGLMPDAIELAEHMHAEWPDRIVTWKPIIWFWPNFIREQDRSFCHGHVSSRVEVRSTRDVLKRVFASRTPYIELPTLYYSFVPRQLVERIRSKRGRYFNSINPDIYSGLINAISAPDYIYSYRPLSVVGVSKHSTGSSYIYSEHDSSAFDMFKQENADKWDETLDPRLVGDFILEVKLADGYIKFKEQELPDDREISLDMPALLRLVSQRAARYRIRHAEVERAIREMATRNGLDPELFKAAPPRQDTKRKPFSYSITGEHNLVNMQFFTNDAYVRTIDDFVATAGQMCCPAPDLRAVDVRTTASRDIAAGPQSALTTAKQLIRAAMGQVHP